MLRGVRVGESEVELSRDQEDHGPHGGDARAASGFALGGLEHPIEGLDEAVGRLFWSRAAEAWATRWNLSKVTRAFGSWSGTPLIKALDIVDADRADFAQASPCVRPGV